MSETNPQGSPRTDREVTAALARIFEPEAAEEADVEEQEEGAETGLSDEDAGEEADEQDEDEDAVEGEDADTEDEEPSESFAWTLKVNGQEQTITDEDEARSLAQRGLHYTQEMQALRTKEREFDGERQAITAQLRQKEDAYAKALEALEQTFGSVLGAEPDWTALYSENPERYAHTRAQWDQLAAIRSDQQRIAAERQAEAQREQQARLQAEADQLQAKLPEWTDPDKRRADIEMIRTYGLEVGYSDQELAQVWNHRDLLVLRDAARYRQATQAGKQEAKKAASKTVEPGKSAGPVNAKTRRHRQQRERARKTGKEGDIAPLMRKFVT